LKFARNPSPRPRLGGPSPDNSFEPILPGRLVPNLRNTNRFRTATGRFGGDPEIVGAKVSVDGHPVTIVGVAPEGFYGINLLSAPQAYLPLGMPVYGGQAPIL